VSGMTRRQMLAAGGAGAPQPALAEAPPPAVDGTVQPVPSGRADGVRTGGSRRVPVVGGYEVWVKQIGTGDIPMLTLHGGPGATHFYLECFEDFLPTDRIRFYYYDQLGCGFSDAPNDPSLWTLDRFRQEVETVRAALGLERFVLYGQSWGGLLAIEYALKYPQYLSGLVISSMTASYPAYVAYANRLRAALPDEVNDAMKRYEEQGKFDAPEYQDLLMTQLYAKHMCRLDPWPEPLMRAFTHLSQQVYVTMQGPSEFQVTGNLKDWDRWADLPRIDTPTLLIVGGHDTMSVDDIARMGTLIPNARLVVCEKGSHMCMYDDQQTYFDALVPFVLARGGKA
jgi:proline iminopeptidase